MVIRKLFKTETAHIVRNAFSQRCAKSIHGHSYVIEVFIGGPVKKDDGMIIDFGNLKKIKTFIDQFDHATVLWSSEKDDIKQFFITNFDRVLIMKNNPTAENMASLIFKFVEETIKTDYGVYYGCSKVEVHETTTGKAIAYSYSKDDIFTHVQGD